MSNVRIWCAFFSLTWTVLVSGCGTGEREASHVKLMAVSIEGAFVRISMRSQVNAVMSTKKSVQTEEEERADIKKIDEMISFMNARSWKLCREEIIEMRAILDRTRFRAYEEFQITRDRVRIGELASRVNSKII